MEFINYINKNYNLGGREYTNSDYAEKVAKENFKYNSKGRNTNFNPIKDFPLRIDKKNPEYIYRKMKRTSMVNEFHDTGDYNVYMKDSDFDQKLWDSITEDKYMNYNDPFDFKKGEYKLEDIKKHKGIEFIDFSNEDTQKSLGKKNILFIGDVHGDISIVMNILKHYYYSKTEDKKNPFKDEKGNTISLSDDDFKVEFMTNLDYSNDAKNGKGNFRDNMINSSMDQKCIDIFKNIQMDSEKKSIYTRINFEDIIQCGKDGKSILNNLYENILETNLTYSTCKFKFSKNLIKFISNNVLLMFVGDIGSTCTFGDRFDQAVFALNTTDMKDKTEEIKMFNVCFTVFAYKFLYDLLHELECYYEPNNLLFFDVDSEKANKSYIRPMYLFMGNHETAITRYPHGEQEQKYFNSDIIGKLNRFYVDHFTLSLMIQNYNFVKKELIEAIPDLVNVNLKEKVHENVNGYNILISHFALYKEQTIQGEVLAEVRYGHGDRYTVDDQKTIIIKAHQQNPVYNETFDGKFTFNFNPDLVFTGQNIISMDQSMSIYQLRPNKMFNTELDATKYYDQIAHFLLPRITYGCITNYEKSENILVTNKIQISDLNGYYSVVSPINKLQSLFKNMNSELQLIDNIYFEQSEKYTVPFTSLAFIIFIQIIRQYIELDRNIIKVQKESKLYELDHSILDKNIRNEDRFNINGSFRDIDFSILHEDPNMIPDGSLEKKQFIEAVKYKSYEFLHDYILGKNINNKTYEKILNHISQQNKEMQEEFIKEYKDVILQSHKLFNIMKKEKDIRKNHIDMLIERYYSIISDETIYGKFYRFYTHINEVSYLKQRLYIPLCDCLVKAHQKYISTGEEEAKNYLRTTILNMDTIDLFNYQLLININEFKVFNGTFSESVFRKGIEDIMMTILTPDMYSYSLNTGNIDYDEEITDVTTKNIKYIDKYKFNKDCVNKNKINYLGADRRRKVSYNDVNSENIQYEIDKENLMHTWMKHLFDCYYNMLMPVDYLIQILGKELMFLSVYEVNKPLKLNTFKYNNVDKRNSNIMMKSLSYKYEDIEPTKRVIMKPNDEPNFPLNRKITINDLTDEFKENKTNFQLSKIIIKHNNNVLKGFYKRPYDPTNIIFKDSLKPTDLKPLEPTQKQTYIYNHEFNPEDLPTKNIKNKAYVTYKI